MNELSIRKKIINRLENHSIDLFIGTHSLFQEKLNYPMYGAYIFLLVILSFSQKDLLQILQLTEL